MDTPHKALIAKINRLRIIVIVLLLLLLIAFIFFILSSAKHSFIGHESNIKSKGAIEKYRDRWSWNKKTKIVWYDADEIRHYLDSIYKPLTQSFAGDANCKTCKWVVGFYFMRKFNAAGNPRTDFYVIPTLVDTADPKNPIPFDFADTVNTTKYVFKTGVKLMISQDSIAYDTGHMWP